MVCIARRLRFCTVTVKMPWPWQGPVPAAVEVTRVGKPASMQLVRHLRYSLDMDEDANWNLRVEQQVELVLCMIFGYQPGSGETVYGIRSSDPKNGTVRHFWFERVHAYARTEQ